MKKRLKEHLTETKNILWIGLAILTIISVAFGRWQLPVQNKTAIGSVEVRTDKLEECDIKQDTSIELIKAKHIEYDKEQAEFRVEYREDQKELNDNLREIFERLPEK